MDAFVTRKKRKHSPDQNTSDDEPTEVKLAILSSLHPEFPHEALLDILLAHDGAVTAASASLSMPGPRQSLLSTKKPSLPSAVGHQASLRSFASIPQSQDPSSASAPSPKKARLLSRKGATLHLFDPVDVADHTPCSIIHNFLPSDLANDLLHEMLLESETFGKITFKLFDNVVTSPHTSSFYVGTYDEMQAQKYEYLYNGARIDDVRKITPQLDRVKPFVQQAVNREIQLRIRTRYPGGRKLQYQSSGPWSPNAAFVNCYNGPTESVGWHADQLTYLGPRAVIGSLSLGVAREFRVRRIVPKDDDNDKTTTDDDAAGQISIHLPHNSLLVMHAEMQEEWKHSVAPQQTIDPHPIAGNRRINVTYRDYKPHLHPRLTPRCKCGIPTVLRVAARRKNENRGRYFWMCHAGYVPSKEGCSFFQWARFDDDGVPIWETDGGKTVEEGKKDERKA
ncbi:hypothetical protein BD289DRAFT_372048 [Coniella lustricola]|uniref:Uncharacterized protein n=1 Tax=Coniella lustricola TaxID=2025994 RepID=A0A2T3A2X2_9PEZI|nr:hypothetical protein BD289DRAFT_372048 [Coniella lustricola]